MQHLELHSFAALASASRALRNAVVLLTEEDWQGAARLTHSAEHPVHRAACVAEYLRTQHSVHANIAASRCTTQELVTAEGVISPDLTQHATLATSSEVFSPLVLYAG